MRRCQQAYPAAEIMRAKNLARSQDITRNTGADAQPAPLRDIGLNDPQHVITQHLLETCAARDIFAGRERQADAFAQALPFLPGPVGADRFFEPCETKLGKMRRDLQCTFRRPGLVSVRSQHAISDELVKRGQAGAVRRSSPSSCQPWPALFSGA